MNITTIIHNDHLLRETTKFLSFEDKMNLSKTYNKNCFHYYDFRKKSFMKNSISDIFSMFHNDDIWEYLSDFCSDFICSMGDYYDDYNGYDTDDFINDEYNNIAHERVRELSELFHATITSVYSRKIVEAIEDANVYMKYDEDVDIFELDNKLNVDIGENIMDYYKDVFENENIKIFCYRCGMFGHHMASKNCMFFNRFIENRETSKDVKYTLSTLINKVITNDLEEKKRIAREPLLCISCKINCKNKHCTNSRCGSCCSGCEKHVKKSSMYDDKCVNCNNNLRHTKCKNKKCGGCCDCEKHIRNKP